MDPIQNTLEEVIENRFETLQYLENHRLELKQYEEYLIQLQDVIEETQISNSQNKEILALNNFIKNALNKNSKVVKDLVGTVYNYTQQIEDRLCKIINQETSLEELYNENEERYKNLEANYQNHSKLLTLLEQKTIENMSKGCSDQEQHLDDIKAQLKQLDQSWKNIMDEHDEKRKVIQTASAELEMLKDQLKEKETEVEAAFNMLEEKQKNQQRLFEEISEEIETLDNKVLQEEKDIILISTDVNDFNRNAQEIQENLNDKQIAIEKLNEETVELDKQIRLKEDMLEKITIEYTAKIQSGTDLIEKRKIELSSCQNEALELTAARDELSSKINEVDDEITEIKRDYESLPDKDKITSEMKIIADEHENLTKEEEQLTLDLASVENETNIKKAELEKLLSTEAPELQEIKQKIASAKIEMAFQKDVAEKELQDNDSNNKQLQQSYEELEIKVKTLNSEVDELRTQKEQNERNLNMLSVQHEFLSNEIKQLENLKKQKTKAVLPTKRPQPRPRPPPPAKKSKFRHDSDNSSIDGERFSYAEFMAKKKMMKDGKH